MNGAASLTRQISLCLEALRVSPTLMKLQVIFFLCVLLYVLEFCNDLALLL